MSSVQWPTVVIVVLTIFLVFLVVREFWCWYFKINERIKNQQQIIELIKLMQPRDEGTPASKVTPAPDSKTAQVAADTGGW